MSALHRPSLVSRLTALILIVMAGGATDTLANQSGAAESGAFAPATIQGDAARIAQASTPPSVAAPAPPPQIDALPDGPPLGSLSLSQLVLKIEGEPDFAYVRGVAWRDGKYAVTYVTRDGTAHERVLDPRTGRATQPAPDETGGGGGAPDSSVGTSGGSSPVLNPSGIPSNSPSIPPPRASGQTR